MTNSASEISHRNPLPANKASGLQAGTGSAMAGVWLVVGIALWIALFGEHPGVYLTLGPWGWGGLVGLVAVMLVILLIPPVGNSISRRLDRIRFLSPTARLIGSGAASLFASIYLYTTARGQGRPLRPFLHDEFSYLIQAHQLARGHLWMPAHPLSRFFDSFQLIVHPVYASAYFPGTALLYVPGIWLHIPPWITSLFICGIIAGLLFRIVAELIDGLAGWLSVLLLLSCQIFRYLSVMTMGQPALLLYALLAIVTWLEWRRTNQRAYIIATGLFLGLAAVTRPVDALCFIVPLCVSLLSNWRAIALVAIGAVPLLVLQLILNHGVTGDWFETPFRMYADRDYPNTAFGFHAFDPHVRPASDLPQKQDLYQSYLPEIQRHQPASAFHQAIGYRLRLTLSQASTTPFPLLVILLPVAISGSKSRRWPLLLALPLFVALYAFYVFFFSHYVLAVLPALILGILMGAESLANFSPRIRGLLVIFIASLAIASLPEFDATLQDQLLDAPLIDTVNSKLAALPGPSIVLFRYAPGRDPHQEPVYNADAAWPDDAPIIRAHDRGKENGELFRYYASRQPARVIYRFDESDNSLSPLGTAGQLAGMSP